MLTYLNRIESSKLLVYRTFINRKSKNIYNFRRFELFGEFSYHFFTKQNAIAHSVMSHAFDFVYATP